jgi:hypothetical protein
MLAPNSEGHPPPFGGVAFHSPYRLIQTQLIKCHREERKRVCHSEELKRRRNLSGLLRSQRRIAAPYRLAMATSIDLMRLY